MKIVKKFQNPSGHLPSYLFDVSQPKAPEEYTDTIEPAVITAKLPEKFHGSQAAAARYAAGQKWGKENVAEPRDKFAQEYVLPAMVAAAFGMPGLVGAGGGFAVDATINALTNGNKNSFGDLFVNPEKHPILNTAVNFFNPGYYLGGFAITKPLVQTVSPRTAVALGLEKEYLKNEIKALNQNIRNWTGNKTLERNILAGKLGWAPSQTKTLWHASNEPVSELKITYPAWDVTERNAPLGHVWLSDSKIKSGFLNDRPYHKFDKVELKKPMIQIGEAIGDGKNNTRNQILDFAQKSSADALEFNNIADNTLQNQNVYAIFKDVPLRRLKVNISEAERLGIPKGERSNPKALEDPQYWGYQQWNDRYNDAIESGNMEEIQRLRDLHFYTRAKNNVIVDESGIPIKVYHGSPEEFNVFDYTKASRYPDGHFFFGEDYNYVDTHARRRAQYLGKDRHYTKSYYLYDTEKYPINKNKIDQKIEPHITDANGFPLENELSSYTANYITTHLQDKPHIIYGYDVGREPLFKKYDYAVPFNTQMKLTNPITYDKGKIIPIVKRDNFHNPDIRYKQGGILKAQNGTFEDFYKTLPINQQDSTDFNVRRYWELSGKPKNFTEAVESGAYKLEDDGKYHGYSVAENENGDYEFMKKPNHPTLKYELDWYNSDTPDAVKFRKQYQLDTTSTPWKYKIKLKPAIKAE